MLEKLKELKNKTNQNIEKFEYYMAENYKTWPDEEFLIALEILGTMIHCVFRLEYVMLNFNEATDDDLEFLGFFVQEIEILNECVNV